MTEVVDTTKQQREAQADKIILEAARKELRWGVGDKRNDPERWKTEVRLKIMQECGLELMTYL